MFTTYVYTLLIHFITALYTQACSSSTQPLKFIVYFRSELLCSLTQREMRLLATKEMDANVSQCAEQGIYSTTRSTVRNISNQQTETRSRMIHAALHILYQERVGAFQARPEENEIITTKKAALAEQSTCLQETWLLAAPHKPPSTK